MVGFSEGKDEIRVEFALLENWARWRRVHNLGHWVQQWRPLLDGLHVLEQVVDRRVDAR